DVAPTLLDLAGIQDPLSRQFQGRSLAPLMMGPLMMGKTAWADRPVYSETYYPRDSFGWSALRSLSTARHQYIDAPRQELYELAQDPDEKRDVYAERTAEAAALRSQLLDIERRYIDFAAPASTAAPGLGRAYFLQAQDRQAAGAFEFALRLNPQNSLARLALAKVYWRANLPEKAEPELAQVVKDRPEFAEARADHGIVLAKLGK